MRIANIAAACVLFLASAGIANAACGSLPYNLTNGTTADANQVMANFNYLLSCGVLQGYLSGNTLSNDGTSPNTVIDTTAGVATSDDGTVVMVTAAMTKNANASWSVGSSNGCLDSGSSLANSTWYHLFVIERTDTGVVDELCSTSATSPTLPSPYTKKRRVGSFKTDSLAHILAFIQVGDTFMWGNSVLDVNVTAPGSSAVTRTLSVPLGVVTEAIVLAGIQTQASGDAMLLSPLAVSDVPPGFGSGTIALLVGSAGIASNQARVLTNTSSQSRSRMNAGGVGSSEYVTTLGWRDFLGR